MNKKLLPLSSIGFLIFVIGMVTLLNLYFTNLNIMKVPLKTDYSLAATSLLQIKSSTDGLTKLSLHQSNLPTNIAANISNGAELQLLNDNSL